MFAEHADITALDGAGIPVDGAGIPVDGAGIPVDGAGIPVDGCHYILNMLCQGSDVSVCLFPVDSLQIQVQRCSSCHVWQRPL